MCGIVASIAKTPSFNNKRRVLQQFNNQRARGTNGFGFVGVLSKDKSIVFARSKWESEIMKALSELEDTDLLIFHHRIPTSSPNTPKANHPILIENKDLENKYFLVHNGHIANCDSLKGDHEKLGIIYSTIIGEDTFTDSEALGIELALHIEGKKKGIEAMGGEAVFLLQVGKDNVAKKFFFHRNSSPTKLYSNQAGIFLSSVGKGEETKSDTLFELDLSTYKITKRKLEISEGYYTFSRDWRSSQRSAETTEEEVTSLLGSGTKDYTYFDSYIHIPEVKTKYDKLLELEAEKLTLEDEINDQKLDKDSEDSNLKLVETELLFVKKSIEELKAEIYTLIHNYIHE